MQILANQNDVIVQVDLAYARGVQTVDVPRDSQFLGLSQQFNLIILWYLCSPDIQQIEPRKYQMYQTGDTIMVNGIYRGTVMLNTRVLHVFEDHVS